MSVTQSQIARLLGVSQRTVSEAFRPDGRISPRTRQRILDHATRLGYRPNTAARAARTGRFNAIAFLRGTALGTDWFPVDLIQGIEHRLEGLGSRLIMARLHEPRLDDENYLPHILREHAVDGLLINYLFQIPHRLEQWLSGSDVPAIWLNIKRPTGSVYPDDEHVGYASTCRLLELGHRRIAFAWLPTVPVSTCFHFSGPDRARGYRRAVAEAGLTDESVANDEMIAEDQRVDTCRSWLVANPQVTGIVCYSTREAEALAVACLSLGRPVPQTLSLIGASASPSWISHYLLPERAMGEQAVNLLQRRIAGDGKSAPSLALRGKVYDAQTTALAPEPLHRKATAS